VVDDNWRVPRWLRDEASNPGLRVMSQTSRRARVQRRIIGLDLDVATDHTAVVVSEAVTSSSLAAGLGRD
jgi:hypothetical protein